MSVQLTKSICLWAAIILFGFAAKAQPVAQFSATPLSGCAPLVVNFHDESTGSPNQWKWDLGNSTISFLQHPAATYFNPGTYTVKLVVQNAAGKDSITKTQYITVYALPTVNFSATPLNGCFPLPVQFTDNSTPGSGTLTTWLWDFGDGNTSTLPNPGHVYTAQGNYNVSLMITNSNGCTKTLTRTNYISLSDGVHAVFTNNAPLSCSAPETILFTNQSTGTGVLSYQWAFGDGGTSTAQNPSHTYTTAGSYSVQLIVTNANGCRDTVTHASAINIGTVHANFDVPATICTGSAVTFNNSSTPAPLLAVWTFGDATGSAAISPVKVYAAPGVYSVKMVADFGGCRDSITKDVTVLPKPTSAFTGSPLIFCSVPATVNFTNTSTGAVSYEWSFGDGNTATSSAPSHTYTTPGSYNVTLISTNANGCTDTLVLTAYVKIQLPQVAINNLPHRDCAPLTHTFTATITSLDPVVGYQWNFGDGNTSTAISPTHIFPAGIYDIQLIITTASGCTDTVTVIAGIKSSLKPHANFSADPRDVCAYLPVNFTDLSTGTVNEWHWDFGDGGTSTEQNPSHTYSDTGLFNIQLIVGNDGCYDTLKINDYIHVKPPIALFDVAFNCDLPFIRVFTDHSIGADEWHWNFGDGNTSTTPSPTHTYAATGTYIVTLLVRNLQTGCEYTKTTQVVVADEHANFSAAQTEICRNISDDFTAVSNGGIVNYEWDFGDGATGTGSTISHIYVLAGTYTVRLIITDVVGCKDTLTRTNYIKVNGPTADFSSAVPGSCLMTAITFNDLTTTDGSHNIIQWTWNYGDGNIQTVTAPPFQHSYANAGVYGLSLLVVDAAGCRDSIVKNFLLTISTPVADFISADTLSCPNRPITFTNTSTGPGLTYQWDFGDGNTGNQQSPVHNYTATGIYTVHLHITDQYGCTSDITKPNFIKIIYPVADFSPSATESTCPPLIVQFTNTSVNQTTFNWDFGDGTFSTAESPSHFYNVAGTYIAQLSITGPGGCTSVKTQVITVRGPRGTFTYGDITGCKPLTVNFVATTQDQTSFIWDFNDGTTIPTPDSVISHTYTIPGIYVPKMILKDAAGCTVPITGLDTIVVSGVTAQFTADTLLRCGNGSVVFTNGTQSNDVITGYLWDFGDGNTSTDVSPTHFYATEGLYQPKLYANTQMGCTDSLVTTVPVKVVKIPQISVTQSANGCIPLTMNFSGNLLNADTSVITWQWQVSNGASGTGQTLNPLVISTAGIYNAILYATNSSGCKDTANASIEAYGLPVVNAGADKMICEGTGQPIVATGAATYSWSPATGLSCTVCPAPVANPANQSEYIVTGTSAQGCINRDTIVVSVKHPFNMLQSPGDTLCAGEVAHLSASGAFSYTWSPSAGLDHTNTPSVTASPSATTTYMAVGHDDVGCFTDTAYYNVKVYPIPSVSAGTDKTINVGRSVTLVPTISADVNSVVWSPTTGVISTVYPTVTVQPTEDTRYRVVVKNAGGCKAESFVTVHVLCNGANVFIPNTFSPNGDGANEVFYPRGTGLFTIKIARVFNRWGEVVYEKNDFKANDEKAGWDGSYKGQKLAPDVFVYMFEIVCDNNTTLVYKGNIALVR
jgi:gliding motility-associated-like protein